MWWWGGRTPVTWDDYFWGFYLLTRGNAEEAEKLADMATPRDIQHKDEEKVRHLTNLQIAFATLREVMHMADGTNAPGEHQEHVWAAQHMVTASIYLDIAQMFAEKAVTRR